jgi:hypothetical protein
MKVTPQDLAIIREAVSPLDTPERREHYRAGDFPRAAAVQDLNKRYCWDLFHRATAGTTMVSDLYAKGYNDVHLYTALKAVVPAL